MLIMVLSGQTFVDLKDCSIRETEKDPSRDIDLIPGCAYQLDDPATTLFTFEDEMPVILKLPKGVAEFLRTGLPVTWSHADFDRVSLSGDVQIIYINRAPDGRSNDKGFQVMKQVEGWCVEEAINFTDEEFPEVDGEWGNTQYYSDDKLLGFLQHLTKYMK